MKVARNISGKTLQAIFGIVIGFFVLTQSILVNEQIEDRTEQSDTDKKDQQQITKPAVTHSSSLQINLDYQSYLVAEVFYQNSEDEKAPIKSKVLLTVEKALKVLFRQFISPNAP